MKALRPFIPFIYFLLILIPIQGLGQISEAGDSSNNKLISAASEIIASASTCALITLDDEGRPRVRAMDPFSPEDDFTVWFGTNSKSRKVSQIKHDPRVTLYYLDGDASGYVMIHGIAQLIDDKSEKEKHWKNEWEAFYPDKNESYLLIKVSPIWMEVSSVPRGINGDKVSWQPPMIRFNSN